MHDSAFGNVGRAASCSNLAGLGTATKVFSGTRLRFSYATAFKEPRLEETFNGIPAEPFNISNPGLKPEHTRAFEAGLQQDFLRASKYVFTATYFNNLFA